MLFALCSKSSILKIILFISLFYDTTICRESVYIASQVDHTCTYKVTTNRAKMWRNLINIKQVLDVCQYSNK